MPDEYIARYQRLIRATVHNDEDLEDLINKIYEDGFTDGQDYQNNLDPMDEEITESTNIINLIN